MKKCMKPIYFAAVLIFFMLGSNAYALPYTVTKFSPAGAVKTAPPENIFYTKDGKGFILLDYAEGENGGYFCIAYDSYGNSAIAPWSVDSKLDTESENKIGYKMNAALLGTENIDGLEKLPDEIIKSIDKEHVWDCDAGTTFSDYTLTAGVNLISVKEYLQYVSVIGTNDGSLTQWWTRTPYVLWDNFFLYIGDEPIGSVNRQGANFSLQIRPCFWLYDDFFETTELSVDKMGDNIKKILSGLGEDKLREIGYSDEDIEKINTLGQNISESFSLTMPDAGGYWYGVTSFDFEVETRLQYAESKTYHFEIYLDDRLKEERDVYIPANSSKKISFNTGVMTNDEHSIKVQIYDAGKLIWERSESFYVVEEYTPQFMDEYTGKGFNHHLANAQYATGLKNEMAMMNRIGVMDIRDGFEWSYIETIKKEYDWSYLDILTPAIDMKGTFMCGFGFNNNLYSGFWDKGDSTKWAPVSKEVYDNYCDWLAETVKRYKNIDYSMIWNEPIGDGFWKPGVDIPSYSNLVNVTGRLARQELEEMGESTDFVAGSARLPYLDDIINKDGYSAFDKWTTGYTTPNMEVTGRNAQSEYLKKTAGGWKGLVAYEFGVSTSEVTQEEQARRLITQMLSHDERRYEAQYMYQFSNFGRNTTSREENFGVVTVDGAPKEALYAVAAHFKLLNGAKAIGKTVDGDLYTYYYYKDGEVVAVAFCNNGTVRQKLPVSCSVLDMSGNPVKLENGEVVIGLNPVYIFDLDKETAMNGAGNQIRDEFELFIDYYATLMGEEQEYDSLPGKFNEATSSVNVTNQQYCMDYMMDAEEGAFGYEIIKDKVTAKIDEYFALTQDGLPTAEELEAYINSYYALGLELMEDYKDGNIHMSEREFSGLLYSLHFIGEYMANVYMMSVPSNEQFFRTDALNEIRALETEMTRRENEVAGGIMQYSRAMSEYCEEYASEANEVCGLAQSSPQKAGVVKSRSLMAENLVKWVEAFMELESISHSKILLQMTRENRTFYNFAENTAVFSLYNFGEKEFRGTICLYDSEGTQLFSAEAVLPGGESTEIKKDFVLANSTEDRSKYTMRLYSQGELYYEEVIDDIEIAEQAVITMNTSTVPAEQIKEVSFNIENTFNSTLEYTVAVTPPQGWVIEDNEKTVSVEAGKTATVAFEVSSVEISDFNEYYFGMSLYSDGVELVNQTGLPLQFTYIPRAESEISVNDFNGDISGWSNAYPVMVSAPDNPEDPASWEDSDHSLRLYAKWTSDNLYLLARVNDDTMLNDKLGNEIWNGDNIQFSVDTTNSKTTNYDDGDYEFGVALTDTGLQHYVWTGASDGFNDMEYKIVRNDEEKTTLYLLKIPSAALSPMSFTAGYRFGMNVVLNDADTVQRDFFDELTEGTAYIKSPSYYHTWILGN